MVQESESFRELYVKSYELRSKLCHFYNIFILRKTLEKHPFSINHYFFTSQLLNLIKNGKGRIRIIRREKEKNK